MKCPDCGGRLRIVVDDSRELILECELSSHKPWSCHYVVGIHEIPVLENELQALIDTAPQFLLSRNMAKGKKP